jgi:hypothetical protein
MNKNAYKETSTGTYLMLPAEVFKINRFEGTYSILLSRYSHRNIELQAHYPEATEAPPASSREKGRYILRYQFAGMRKEFEKSVLIIEKIKSLIHQRIRLSCTFFTS